MEQVLHMVIFTGSIEVGLLAVIIYLLKKHHRIVNDRIYKAINDAAKHKDNGCPRVE